MDQIIEDQTDLERKMMELRMAEIEVREEVLAYLHELHRRQLWKAKGYKSLGAFCRSELDYSSAQTRDILERFGLIVTSKCLISDDSATQTRIEGLRAWRRRKASLHGLAPFRILTNRTLMRIAEVNPCSMQDLSEISGIGPRKIEDFGNEILGILSTP